MARTQNLAGLAVMRRPAGLRGNEWRLSVTVRTGSAGSLIPGDDLSCRGELGSVSDFRKELMEAAADRFRRIDWCCGPILRLGRWHLPYAWRPSARTPKQSTPASRPQGVPRSGGHRGVCSVKTWWPRISRVFLETSRHGSRDAGARSSRERR